MLSQISLDLDIRNQVICFCLSSNSTIYDLKYLPDIYYIPFMVYSLENDALNSWERKFKNL